MKSVCLKEIFSDVFDISSRVKEIDSGYYVVYNFIKNRYEIHHREQVGNTLCVIVPYLELDARTIDLVQKTRIENMDKLMVEIEKNNAVTGEPTLPVVTPKS